MLSWSDASHSQTCPGHHRLVAASASLLPSLVHRLQLPERDLTIYDCSVDGDAWHLVKMLQLKSVYSFQLSMRVSVTVNTDAQCEQTFRFSSYLSLQIYLNMNRVRQTEMKSGGDQIVTSVVVEFFVKKINMTILYQWKLNLQSSSY